MACGRAGRLKPPQIGESNAHISSRPAQLNGLWAANNDRPKDLQDPRSKSFASLDAGCNRVEGGTRFSISNQPCPRLILFTKGKNKHLNIMKLHELLAVANPLKAQAAKVVADLSNTFEKKRHLFEAKIVRFDSSVEGIPSGVEAQSDIQSTVDKELKWVSGHIIKALDAELQISVANTQAKADVVLDDGSVLLTGVPATALLELEKSMAGIHALVSAIPTLDPAKGFTVDEANGYYKARPITKGRTKKDKVVIVKYAATPEHPAQTELVDKDVPIGVISEQEWSGLITPMQKAELIANVEQISRAIRQARSRANEQEVDKSQKIGSVIFNKIFG